MQGLHFRQFKFPGAVILCVMNVEMIRSSKLVLIGCFDGKWWLLTSLGNCKLLAPTLTERIS